MTRSALMRSIHHGWFSCSGTDHLHPGPEPLGVLVLDPDDAGQEPAVQPRGQRPRGAVRADDDRLTGGNAALARVGDGDLHLSERALELELRYTLDRGAAEKAAVAHDLQAASVLLGGTSSCCAHGHVLPIARREGGMLLGKGARP